ncbi:MAG TPA: right-handed parallel beta-helix repeat-containing protein [Hymenobacter sp.]|uniref:right-handed parallel beta-helix repeat-containing protein n=1 Tax=Hymenobacter sp. TaxID=1898978 RepID=UPI002D7FB8AD|nr:right-handed parallel beta-helix repeat-containing protein [Hymenobacter sp.]HET9503520.1 right-handed parallel beta-helix repeat-containing protein [Hymenobacter sp.]
MNNLCLKYFIGYKGVKWAIGALLLLLSGFAALAQPTLHKDLKKDFGAVGDGRTNDQAAFQKAADFFNQRAKTPAGTGRAVLHLPAGTYLVGEPGFGIRDDLFQLNDCRNLLILGDDSATTEIRYADSLRYGAFDPDTRLPYEAPTAWFTDRAYDVGLSTCISLQRCENVEIASLTLNGNSPRLLVGGHWGDTGIQLAADGVFVSGSRFIRLRKLAVHHFGRDGIQVLNHLAKSVADPVQEGIVLENSRFDYNGRQGLSITGVNGLRATNCSFSHTGRVVIPSLNKPLYSNPGAGIDIEPEGGYAANVRLESCRLVDNAGQALVSDRYGSGLPTTKNIVLRDCLLWGVSNWSAWVRQTDFLFENCRIYGAFVTGCALAKYATRFVGCIFEDRPYRGEPAYGQHLVYSNQEARAMSFTNCRFVGTRNYLLLAVPAAPDSASRFRLHDCAFEMDNAELPLGGTDQLTGVVFSGNTVFTNGPHRTDSLAREIVLGRAGVPGSAEVAARGSLQLRAPGCRYRLPAGLRLGQASSVIVGASSALVLSEQTGQQPALYIGPKARLTVRQGGALELPPGTRLTVAGELVLEAGARVDPAALARVQTVGRGRLRVAAPSKVKN